MAALSNNNPKPAPKSEPSAKKPLRENMRQLRVMEIKDRVQYELAPIQFNQARLQLNNTCGYNNLCLGYGSSFNRIGANQIIVRYSMPGM